jgi:hypothetical protein
MLLLVVLHGFAADFSPSMELLHTNAANKALTPIVCKTIKKRRGGIIESDPSGEPDGRLEPYLRLF